MRMNISGQRLSSAMVGLPRLLDEWRNGSLKAGWRFPEDWADPAVELLAQTHAENLPLGDAVARLGTSRAFQGVGVREAMLDLGAFFQALKAPVDQELMCSLVEAWVEENSTVETASCTDPSSGLATVGHLERILYEFSVGAASDREALALARVPLTHAVVERRPAWATWADLGQIFEDEFAGLHATAAIHGSVLYILMPSTGTAAPAALDRFLERLSKDPRLAEGPVTATIGPLPGTSCEFSAVAAELHRSHMVAGS